MTETEAAAANGAEKTVEKKTEDVTPEHLSKIDRQINYYFGDYNFPRDKFLQQQAQLDDGWVPLEVMLKCARLKALTEDAETVILALANSKDSVLEISEDKKKVRRNRPAPDVNEEAQLATKSRTVYCKGFPTDEKLDNLLEYFSKFGDCETVLMRHYRDKTNKTMVFKGSVFVVFRTEELAKTFMELESVKFNETEVIKKWQVDYLDEKKKERDDRSGSKNKFSKPAEGGEPRKTDSDETIVLPTKSTLSIKDIPGDVTREDIKSAILSVCESAKIAFIDFDKGCVEATIRLSEQDSAAAVLTALGEEAKVKICGVDLPVRVLTEEEEKAVLEKAERFLNSRRMFGSRGGGRGGYRRGGKRRGGGRGGYRGAKRPRND